MEDRPWYERIWTPGREVVDDDVHVAEASFACIVIGVALIAFADGRQQAMGMAFVAFAAIVGALGLYRSIRNRYPLGVVLATCSIVIATTYVDDLRRIASDVFA